MTFYDRSEVLFLPRRSLCRNRNGMSIDVFPTRQVRISWLRGRNDPRILRLSSEAPDEIYRPRLLVQQAVQRLHAVAVNFRTHWRDRYSSIARRMCSATESPVFSDRTLSAAITGSGKNMCVRFMHILYLSFHTTVQLSLRIFLPGLNAGVHGANDEACHPPCT